MDSDKPGFRTIHEYIAAHPPEMRALLETMRAAIHAAAPDAQEIISYQMPAFYLKGNRVYFGAGKNHIGFYPTPSAIQAFAQELSAYEGAKGSMRFPLDWPCRWRWSAKSSLSGSLKTWRKPRRNQANENRCADASRPGRGLQRNRFMVSQMSMAALYALVRLLEQIHGEARTLLAVDEQPLGEQGASDAQVRSYQVQTADPAGAVHTDLVVTKAATTLERRILHLLASQGCAVPPVVIPAVTGETRAPVYMPFLAARPPLDLGHPDSPLTHSIADGLAGIHAANRLQPPAWLPHASEDMSGRLRRGEARIIDWEQSSYGSLYLDLPNHFTVETALVYRNALARHGYSIPVVEFLERYHEVGRYMGLRYLGHALDLWAHGGAQRRHGRWFLYYTFSLALFGR